MTEWACRQLKMEWPNFLLGGRGGRGGGQDGKHPHVSTPPSLCFHLGMGSLVDKGKPVRWNSCLHFYLFVCKFLFIFLPLFNTFVCNFPSLCQPYFLFSLLAKLELFKVVTFVIFASHLFVSFANLDQMFQWHQDLFMCTLPGVFVCMLKLHCVTYVAGVLVGLQFLCKFLHLRFCVYA